VDDELLEWEEVLFFHPEVRCVDARHVDALLDRPNESPGEVKRKRAHGVLRLRLFDPDLPTLGEPGHFSL
jgi:hypothetical protein